MKDVVIIPTYNEKKNIGKLIKAISSVLPSTHILVVDDNSPDGTAQEVEETKKEVPNLELLLRVRKEGLRKAYVAAFKKVLADQNIRFVCTMDADFSHSANYLIEMLRQVENYSVVVGSRYVKGGGIKGWSVWRKILSRAANFYCRIILRLPVKDCTSGFLCMRASLLRKIDLDNIKAIGFTFLIELKYLLWKNGSSFKEIPIILDNRQEGESKITVAIVLEGFLTSGRLVFKNYFKKIKIFLATAKEVFKKRGIFFIFFYGPKVLCYTYLKKNKKNFTFRDQQYNYFYHIYNCTCLNERAIEIPIILEFLKIYQGKNILEVGNVLSHYFQISHDVLDRYEIAEGVINEDVVNFKPTQKYDLIFSISTLEHVGWDEEPKDPQKVLFALRNLKNCLSYGGKIVITLPLGYNPEMDDLLEKGEIKFTKQYFMKRISNNNEWKEVIESEVKGIKFNFSQYSANGLIIAITESFC